MSDPYVIEAMLLRWGEGPSGRTVTFLLPEDTVQHPFRGLKCGPSHGQRLGLACTLIHDDESTTPHVPDSDEAARVDRIMPPGWRESAAEHLRQAPEKPASGTNGDGTDKHRLSRQAALCCQDARFRKFLVEKLGLLLVKGRALTDSEAADYVRLYCDVASRADFDTDQGAAARWNALHAEYLAESA